MTRGSGDGTRAVYSCDDIVHRRAMTRRDARTDRDDDRVARSLW